MQDPVRGEFRPTGSYDAHPHVDSDFRQVMTGVVTGPGIAPTAGEANQDSRGRWVGHERLPVLVDRADPTNFEILWDEVSAPDYRTVARERAEQAARDMQAGPVSPGAASLSSPATTWSGPVPSPDVSPEWAQGLVSDLVTRGMIPGVDASTLGGPGGPRITVEVDGPSESGTAATAVLRDVADIAVAPQSLPFPGGSLCTLTLEVRSPGGPYTVQTRLGFRSPKTRAAIAVPGKVLPVRIAASDPNDVTVDVAEFYRQNPELAL